MDLLADLWSFGGAFVVTITVIVFIHELGHYALARRAGVRVEVFSIGFGPELFGWTDGTGTRWKFSLLPLGGYVKMFGQSDTGPGDGAGAMSREERAVSFAAKTLGQRFGIVAAGPLANFLLAILLFALVFALVGRSETLPKATTVQEGGAAERAGIEPGDLIVAVDGRAIARFEELRYEVMTRPGQPLELEILRGRRTIVLEAIPETVLVPDETGGERPVGRLGIATDEVVFERLAPLEAFGAGVVETWAWIARIFDFLGQILDGTQSSRDLAGPLGIAQMSSSVAEHGLRNLAMFAAILSVNLGLINLFPVPLLDGGHLLFYVLEALRGRPLGRKAQEMGFAIGIGLVGALFVLVTFNDLARFGLVNYLSGWVP